mmetsp:Transcript_2179/g.3201  ORF Transcript_2179/g.3201 Transcript_2179/m.3201 type:complete len:224 (-) Transcript_2179:846-1517(-)
MRADGRSNKVVSVAHICHPISHRLIDGILQSSLTILHGTNLRSKCIHSEDVEFLALTVHSTHVHGAVESKHGTDSGSSNTVLSRPSLSNNARLSNTLRQKGLSNGIVDLVSASVCEIFTFEPNVSTTSQLRETLGEVKRCRTSNKVFSVSGNLIKKIRIILQLEISFFNFPESLRKSLGNVLSSKFTKSRSIRCFIVSVYNVDDLSYRSSLVLSIRALLQTSA